LISLIVLAKKHSLSIKKLFIPLVLVPTLYTVLSCSSERNNAISIFYHNTTAHYNAYYIAREKLNEAEYQIEKSRNENFNEVLKIYEPMTDQLSNRLNDLADQAIEKASLPIQYHKNSKWVDNSYILIGRARFYKRDFENAIQTFKYVNTKSEKNNERHEALSWLLRSLIEDDQILHARAVSDFLGLEGLNKKKVSIVTLARAHFFLMTEDLESALLNLELGIKYSKPKKARARLHFIAGQIAQELGDDETAESHYHAALKNSPSYELEFYSKLYLAQVTQFDSDTDVKTIQKFFIKLLRDRKNIDFRDKIYYEMAKFELKQDNVNGAIAYLNESIKASLSNQNQKAYSYLMLAELYYERVQKYELSKAYYDSTLQVLDINHKDYKSIKKRHEILIDFTTQLNIVRTEDSLQNLSKMDSMELLAFIDQIIEKELEEKRKELARQEKESTFIDPFDQGGFTLNSSGTGTWYFYNPSATGIGRTEFKRIWGQRKLEDHWRRANKGIINVTPESLALEKVDGFEDYDPEKYSSKEEYEKEKRKIALLNPIPFSEEAFIASNGRLENALYLLGKIYDLHLNELENATTTFLKLLEKFPETENKLEVMYFLYRMNIDYDPETSNKYKNILLNNYPNSVYAKLILNPNFLEDSEKEDKLAGDLYYTAYTAYSAGNLTLAKSKLESLISSFPESSFIDKSQLLLAMIVGKSGDWVEYKKLLENFIKEFPQSDLIPFAQELLAACNKYLEAAIKGAESLISESTGEPEPGTGSEKTYSFSSGDAQFFVLILNAKSLKTTNVMLEFSKFNNKFFSEMKLSSNQILLGDNQFLFSIREFKKIEQAMRYYEKIQGSQSPVKKFKSNSPQYFLISTKNFPLFYELKNVEEYLSFFRENYL
jgi:TolA-binding protein